jgi:putative flippase GtrA
MKKAVRFAAVGVLNTGIDFALFTLLVHGAGWAPVHANVVSYGTGILNSFVLNKFWTFRDSTPLARSAVPFARFLVINFSSLALSTAVVALLVAVLPPVGAKAVSIVVVFAWNFTLTRRFVFAEAREARQQREAGPRP